MAPARALRPATPRLLAFCVCASAFPCLAQPWPPSARRLDDKKKFSPAIVPWKTDTKFNDSGRKHQWCDQDEKLVESFGTAGASPLGVSFRHGLENHTISVVFMQNPNFIEYDEEKQVITGGFFPEILEEAASRAGFHWRSSFAVAAPPDGALKETYDQWIQWAVFNYDLVIGDFSATEERTASGLRFGFPILDESPVLVSVFKDKDPPLYETAFAFHRPFALDLWITIMIGMVLTSIIYLFVEGDHREFETMRHESDGSRIDKVGALGHSLWLTTVSFTGGGNLLPHTGSGKTMSLTWTFVVLLVTAAYTASLASQLVVEQVASAPIKSIEDAIRRNIPICVYKGGAFDNLIANRYPDLALKYPRVWGYDNVRSGNCGAIVKDAFDFSIDIGKKEANPYCDLNVVGEPIVNVGGGFVTNHDSSIWCSNMVIDIISVALHNMYNDGWLEEAKLRFVAGAHDQSCVSSDAKKQSSEALTLVHFSGIFMVHISVCLLGLCIYSMRKTGRTATNITYERAPEGLR